MSELGVKITVNSRNFDRSLRRSWKAEMVRQDPPLIELIGAFEFEVEHSDLGTIRRGTISQEYYWLDRWYNVFQFYEPAGEFRNSYCNINLPPIFEDRVLDYVDLDIDLLVSPDRSIRVLDIEEFEENARLYSIPADVCAAARTAVDELITLIERRDFPFDR